MISFLGIAQTKESGMLYYAIDLEADATNIQAQQAIGLMRNSSMTLYFAKEKSRMDFKLGEYTKNTVVVNGELDSAMVLMINPKNPVAYTASVSELEKMQAKEPKYQIRILDEFKTILGFKCQKAILTSNGVSATYWFTKDIDIKVTGQSIARTGLPGIPLQFSKKANGIVMTYKLANFEWGLTASQKASLFNIVIPKGLVNQ